MNAAPDSSPDPAPDFLLACVADRPRAVALVERHWSRLIFDPGTYLEVFALMSAVSADQLQTSPRAGLIAEVIGALPHGTVPVRLPSGASETEQALRTGQGRELVEIAILAMIAWRTAARPHQAVELANASRPLLRVTALTRFSPAADLAAYWHLQAGQAALHAGDLTQARLDLTVAWTLRNADVTGYVAPSVAPFLALLAGFADDDAELLRWAAEVAEIEAAGGPGLLEWETMIRPLRIAQLLQTVRADEADGARIADDLAAGLGFDELWSFSLFVLATHLIRTGAGTAAERLVVTTLAARSSGTEPVGVHRRLLRLTRCALALAGARPGEARAHLDGVDATFVPDVVTRFQAELDTRAPAAVLTPGETRVLAALTRAESLADVAASLHISRNTLKTHLRHLYEKLGVRSRADAVDAGRQHGLLTD